MKLKQLVAAALIVSLTAGCATTNQPRVDVQVIVDDKASANMANFNNDMAECHVFADKTLSAAQAAAVGAVAGAVLGVAIGALFGLRGRNLGALAGTGALTGGVHTGAKATETRDQIVKRCMNGRGYAVLN